MGKLATAGEHWTLQQFTEVAGEPWYVLQEYSTGFVERQWTGGLREIDALVHKMGIAPEKLPPTTGKQFYRRFSDLVSDECRPLPLPLPASSAGMSHKG